MTGQQHKEIRNSREFVSFLEEVGHVLRKERKQSNLFTAELVSQRTDNRISGKGITSYETALREVDLVSLFVIAKALGKKPVITFEDL